MKIALIGNEPRQKQLFEALSHIEEVVAEVNFDQIDFLSKWRAAAASFSWPRSEWWESYQMHPIIQRRRQMVLRKELGSVTERLQAMVMWGSWFRPAIVDKSGRNVPFVTYIDQSRSLSRLPGEEPAMFLRRKTSHKLQAETYNEAIAVLCMSEWARQQTLESHSLPKEKVEAVGWGPCGVDLSAELVENYPRRPLVLHVSNDFRRKGVDWLLQTAELVGRRDASIEFALIGRLAEIKNFKLPQNVKYWGPIYDREQLANFFRTASVFFLPHRFDRSPHVLVEAMTAALPLIASKQGGAIELIEGTGVGKLCEPGDISAYAESILQLVGDKRARDAAGRAGRVLQASRYNWGSVATKVVGALSKAPMGSTSVY